MSENTLTKIVREVVREWLLANHNRFMGLVDNAAAAAAPIVEREVRDRLTRIVIDDAEGNTETRCRKELDNVRRDLHEVINHEEWEHPPKLAAIVKRISAALGEGGDA